MWSVKSRVSKLKKTGFAASPIDTARPQEDKCCSGSLKTSLSCETSWNFQTLHIYLKIDVFLRFFNEPEAQLPLKTDVSCEASANFHRSSQNATPCHGICTLSPLDAALTMRFEKTSNTNQHDTSKSLKCCACHAKWRWRSPKCCACHQKCNASSGNDAKVLRLSHKTTFDTLQNTSECHEVPRLPRETRLRDAWNLQKRPLLQNSPKARPYGPHANACGRLRNVWRTQPQPPNLQNETGTLATHSGSLGLLQLD